MFGCDYEARRRGSKGQISDIHKVGESERRSSSSYSSVCPLLNDRPDLLCHASVSQLKTSLVRFQPPLPSTLSFIRGGGFISPLEDDQSAADRSEITAKKKTERPYYLSS